VLVRVLLVGSKQGLTVALVIWAATGGGLDVVGAGLDEIGLAVKGSRLTSEMMIVLLLVQVVAIRQRVVSDGRRLAVLIHGHCEKLAAATILRASSLLFD
jgi:hypothetical protein